MLPQHRRRKKRLLPAHPRGPGRRMSPLPAGKPVGQITVSLDDTTIEERDLYPLATVPEGSLWQQLADSVMLWFE